MTGHAYFKFSITCKKGAHEEVQFKWNADHQLQNATVMRHGVTQTTSYEYDALGRRTKKTDAFGATEYLWDGDLMIHSQRGNKASLFVFEPDSFIPLATIQDENTYWYQCDQIGAPQELTDQVGEIVWAADYKVWGEAKVRDVVLKTGTDNWSSSSNYNWQTSTKPTPVIDQPFRFQGQQFDEETGLHYNRFRYYDPAVGRFVSEDPIGLAGGMNNFLYAPNPVGWIDPLGLFGANALAKYKHNSDGTLKSATAKIRPEDLNTGSSTNASSRARARSFGCQNDDAGHAIGNQLGGDGGVNGVFPQALGINRGQFRTFETDIFNSVKAGNSVIVRVVPQYSNGSTRPDEILYQVRENGKTRSATFTNPCCC
ncbi:RHS repeat-associated protein [Undibacterium sp. GrIS 1.2]|uniref:RHS repeat-associated core domain-containing protein n=1 Tax=Undibacterium sp. GrIS 1.2 TaxID=3143933 RepID=UPI0033983DEE